MASEDKTIWQASPSDIEKSGIKGFTDQSKQDSNKAVRSIAEFTNGGGGGAQSYPLTVSEDSRITITFRNSSTGDEITEAPAGTIVRIDCGSMEGNSGSVTCYVPDESFEVFEKSGYLGKYDIYTAVPIGGLMARVYVD